MTIATISSVSVPTAFDYVPMQPQPDTDELAAKGERVILRHGTPASPRSYILIASKGVLTAGWVIGMLAE